MASYLILALLILGCGHRSQHVPSAGPATSPQTKQQASELSGMIFEGYCEDEMCRIECGFSEDEDPDAARVLANTCQTGVIFHAFGEGEEEMLRVKALEMDEEMGLVAIASSHSMQGFILAAEHGPARFGPGLQVPSENESFSALVHEVEKALRSARLSAEELEAIEHSADWESEGGAGDLARALRSLRLAADDMRVFPCSLPGDQVALVDVDVQSEACVNALVTVDNRRVAPPVKRCHL